MKRKHTAGATRLINEIEELISWTKLAKNGALPRTIWLTRPQYEIFTKEYGGRETYKEIPVKLSA